MANCISCSAPLSGPSTICRYCGRRNDTNLHGIHKYTVVKPESERICPRCDIALQTINLFQDEKFYIERCPQCMGLFFDNNELPALLEKSVSNVFRIDTKRLDIINKELFHRDRDNASYVKCPVCKIFMNRTAFGARSGVVVDTCAEHGIWLDGGELKHLLEWKKAGGQLMSEQRKERREAAERKSRANRESEAYRTANTFAGRTNEGNSFGLLDGGDIADTVFSLIRKLF